MTDSMSDQEILTAWTKLAQDARTAVLLTMRNGRPFGSHVPYVFGDDWTRAYLHLSRLALHTQHLLQCAEVSLFLSEPDRPEKNPLALRRMNLQGTAKVQTETDQNYAAAKDRYLKRFPTSAMMFGFGDFSLWELRLEDAHLVLGFGQAYQATAAAADRWIHQVPEQKNS